MIAPIQRLVDYTFYRWLIKINKGKYGIEWGIVKYHSLQIAGTRDSREKALEALSWVNCCALEQHRKFLAEVSEIVFMPYLKDHIVWPHRRIVVLSSTNRINEGPQKLGRMLVASAHYVHLCHSFGKYKSCKLYKLPGVNMLGDSTK